MARQSHDDMLEEANTAVTEVSLPFLQEKKRCPKCASASRDRRQASRNATIDVYRCVLPQFRWSYRPGHLYMDSPNNNGVMLIPAKHTQRVT